MNDVKIGIVPFSFQTPDYRRLLKKFTGFHWQHYRGDPQYIPLLDYEYLGFRLLGIRGFFEANNSFFQHAEMRFFLAMRGEEIVGRCNAFVNRNHNEYWQERLGFLGQFEVIDDPAVAGSLLEAAGQWLKSKGMEAVRGPQNMPINEATPGVMTDGFNSRPVVYYNYNKPYYARLLTDAGFTPIKRVFSWEIPVHGVVSEKLPRVAQKVIERFAITLEPWGKRPLEERKQEMLEIYNDAWGENFGFIPFTKEEFYTIIDDMMMIMDKKMFCFLYIKGEPAAFIGAVPNIAERMAPTALSPRWELYRAARMFLSMNRIKGLRLGYLGVKKKFRSLGLDGVMVWTMKMEAQKLRYEYCDIGWVLEDNFKTNRIVELMGGKPSKTYTIFQKPL